MKKQNVIVVGIGLIVFAAAMAFREYLSTPWVRAAVAAAAFILLGLVIYWAQKRNNNQ